MIQFVMDIQAEIIEVKAELIQLKNEVATATGDREIAIRNQIIAKETQLTTLINLLPKEALPGNPMTHPSLSILFISLNYDMNMTSIS